MESRDTIAAIATGMTDSGIGVIRISGTDAVEVGNRLFRSPSGKEILNHAMSHMMYYGYAFDMECHEMIDEVMAVVMKAPRSFTGEDTVEIQCHGGILVMGKILEAVLINGARLAEPGEFTKRAFLNGRLDLSEAEAVMDVISSQSDVALSISLKQLKGELSRKIRELRKSILYEIAFIESALDDPEHISLEAYPNKLFEKINNLSNEIENLIRTADQGRLIKEGVNTVIVGKPNAGKSSLLNALLGEDRAIVTDIAGTTRDVLQETMRIGNVCLNVVDTAGIRNTENAVEKIGVEKARQYAVEAELLVHVVDGARELDESDRDILSLIKNQKVIVLLNKKDLDHVLGEEDVIRFYQQLLPEREKPMILKISAKDGAGIEEFKKAVEEMFYQGAIRNSNEIIITNIRHKKALQEAFESLKLVKQSIQNGLPEDFYSIDLMNAYGALGRIIGEEVDDDLVEEIFSRFCMGK